MTEKMFIIWDQKDGEPRRGDDGEFLTDGIIGRVGADNVYVRGYAAYREGDHESLEVGQFAVADFSLSGSKGTYRVYRVS